MIVASLYAIVNAYVSINIWVIYPGVDWKTLVSYILVLVVYILILIHFYIGKGIFNKCKRNKI